MELPSKLKIGGHWIGVVLTEELPEDTDADYDSEKLLIRINKRLPQSMRESCLIHEVFHALNQTFDDEHHALMDSLAEQFYQVLVDNGLLK